MSELNKDALSEKVSERIQLAAKEVAGHAKAFLCLADYVELRGGYVQDAEHLRKLADEIARLATRLEMAK